MIKYGWSAGGVCVTEEFPTLHDITDQDAQLLCTQLRARLLEVVSETGGHLASNLGAVE
ncbi:MAG: 1-deoxy-D-xylulose-5-phosphate synthase N-terminal domain-containing protein, partial [Evtepia sp.]